MSGSKTDTLRARVGLDPVILTCVSNPDFIFELRRNFRGYSRRQVRMQPVLTIKYLLCWFRFWAKVVQAYPPRSTADAASPTKQVSTSISSTSDPPHMFEDESVPIHQLGGDLKVPAKEANSKDDPAKYFYKVQILEEQNEKSHEKSKIPAKERVKYNGSLMEVQCPVMR